jgi:hypothetical protein
MMDHGETDIMGGAMMRGRRRNRSLAASLPLVVICLAVAGCSAAVPPPPNSATAAASQPPGPDPNLMPYPKQSLVDVFRGSTEPQGAAAMPHPPSTYMPAGQPYSPAPGQPGAPAAAPAQASNDPSDYLPYPKQSLFDLFSEKPAAH